VGVERKNAMLRVSRVIVESSSYAEIIDDDEHEPASRWHGHNDEVIRCIMEKILLSFYLICVKLHARMSLSPGHRRRRRARVRHAKRASKDRAIWWTAGE
jgi:hypothetical protein